MDSKQAPRSKKAHRRPSTRSAAAMVMAFVVVVGVAATSVVSTWADQTVRRGPLAHAARTIWVHEVVRGTNVSHQGNAVINDRGYGRGTFNCSAVMQVRVYYTTGFISITCNPSGGSIVAAGKVGFFSAGTTATFTGTIPITHGTGKFAHGSGHYRVEGTEVRKTYAVEATTDGWFTY